MKAILRELKLRMPRPFSQTSMIVLFRVYVHVKGMLGFLLVKFINLKTKLSVTLLCIYIWNLHFLVRFSPWQFVIEVTQLKPSFPRAELSAL